jgi:hypothetical protein
MLELKETLSPEEIVLRHKKVFSREMTSEDKRIFLLPADYEPDNTSQHV